jgi:tetratricopeptide (TPR) repeat protein
MKELEIKTNWLIIGIIGILLIITLIASGLYLGQQNEILSLEEQVDSINDDVLNLTSQLVDSEAILDATDDFLTAYFSGWGTYYDALDIEETAWWNYNRADNYYELGNWYTAVGYFDEASTFFIDAQNEFRDAYSFFEDAKNVSVDAVWINLSEQCISMMDSRIKAMTFIRETSEFMYDTCGAYLDGNYDDAHDFYAEAQTKYGYYQDQMSMFAEYQESFGLVLKEYIT